MTHLELIHENIDSSAKSILGIVISRSASYHQLNTVYGVLAVYKLSTDNIFTSTNDQWMHTGGTDLLVCYLNKQIHYQFTF